VLFTSQRRARSGPILVRAVLERDRDGTSTVVRVAFQVTRREGGAVDRNRIRRRLRPLMAAEAARLPPGSYLVQASATARTMEISRLRAHLVRALDGATGPASSPGLSSS
jgi:ribonuclease P protein component